MAQMFRSAFKSLFRPLDPPRKCFPSNYYYLDDPNQPQAPPNVDLEAPIIIAGETRSAVHVDDFSRHVAQLHTDGDIGFSKEYELIQNESIVDEHSSEHSQHCDNKSKNRYLNIIACKYTSIHSFIPLTNSREGWIDFHPFWRELVTFKLPISVG